MEYGVNVHNKFAFLLENDEGSNSDTEKNEQIKKSSIIKKDVKKPVIQEKKVTIVTHNTNNKENVDNKRYPRKENLPRSGHIGEKRNPNGPRRNDTKFNDVDNNENRVKNFNNRPLRTGENRLPRRFPPRGPKVQRNNDVPTDHQEENVEDQNRGPNRLPNGGSNFRRNGPPRFNRSNNLNKTGGRPAFKNNHGHGRGNWKNENENEESNEKNSNEALLNQKTENSAPANENSEDEKHNVVEVEAPRELTLEEWKAQHKSEEPKFNIRKPGEGSDQNVYKKLVRIKSGGATNNKVVEEEETQIKRGPREKALNIQISFNDPQRSKNSRGFRDERRGDGYHEDRRSGGNYRNKGKRKTQEDSQFHLTSESFPALGSK